MLAQNADGPKPVARRNTEYCMTGHARRAWRQQPIDCPTQKYARRKMRQCKICARPEFGDESTAIGVNSLVFCWRFMPAAAKLHARWLCFRRLRRSGGHCVARYHAIFIKIRYSL
jgi:hypothetical protein